MFQNTVYPLMCVSVIHSKVNATHTEQLYFVLQPAQLLKGDIMVSGNREVDSLPPLLKVFQKK